MTSSARPVTVAAGTIGVAAARAVDREDRLLARPRDEVHFAPFAHRPRRFEPRLLDHVAGDHHARRLVGERPAAVLLDADRHRLVARRDRDGRTPTRPRRATLRARPIVRRRARRRGDASRCQNTGRSRSQKVQMAEAASRKRQIVRRQMPFSFDVTHTEGLARRGVLQHAARRRARRRCSCRSARAARSRRSRTATRGRGRARSSSATPITCTCGRATS